MSRGSLSVVLIPLIAGLGLGLYLGWVVSPVKYVDTDPASLSQTHKDDYILMTATLYSADADLEAARARLASLGFDGAQARPAVAAAAQRLITTQQPEDDLRRVAALAAALGVQPDLP
ncbi:MAG: hypothetical protein ACRDH2_02995 [Anaerolineales bacterium]